MKIKIAQQEAIELLFSALDDFLSDKDTVRESLQEVAEFMFDEGVKLMEKEYDIDFKPDEDENWYDDIKDEFVNKYLDSIVYGGSRQRFRMFYN